MVSLERKITNTKMNLELKYLDKISGHLCNYRDKGRVHQLRCPYCQSSGKGKKGKRITDATATGYFYRKNDCLNFKCHRCGTGKQFHNFLKDHFPSTYLDYVKERETLGTTGKGSNCPTFANALKVTGTIHFVPPNFDAEPEQIASNEEKTDLTLTKESVCELTPKYQILPPVRSPQQQAGYQSEHNRLIKQKHERARRRRGDLW